MRSLLARARQNGETHPWIIAFTVMLAIFMEVLDTSVANVALPHIAGNLSAGVDESTWVLFLPGLERHCAAERLPAM